MTDQQEYEHFIIKLGDKIRELKEDYSKLSFTNQKRFEETCQAVFAVNGLEIASEIVQRMLK